MQTRKLVILDTETTGTNETDVDNGFFIDEKQESFFRQEDPVIHRINQIAYIVGEELQSGDIKSLEVFDEMCKPPVLSSIGAVATTGITPEMLVDKPPYAELHSAKILDELNVEENVFIAHNLNFDKEMLSREGFDNKMQIIDTLRVLMHVMPDLESHSMQWYRYAYKLYLKEPQAIDEVGKEISAHDALGDVIVLKLLVEDLIAKGISIDEQIRLSGLPCFITRMKWGKYKGKDINEVAKTDSGYIFYMLGLEMGKAPGKRNTDIIFTFNKLIKDHSLYASVSFTFGKYNGVPVYQVMENDKGYIDWLMKTVDEARSRNEEPRMKKDILAAVEYYLDIKES